MFWTHRLHCGLCVKKVALKPKNLNMKIAWFKIGLNQTKWIESNRIELTEWFKFVPWGYPTYVEGLLGLKIEIFTFWVNLKNLTGNLTRKVKTSPFFALKWSKWSLLDALEAWEWTWRVNLPFFEAKNGRNGIFWHGNLIKKRDWNLVLKWSEKTQKWTKSFPKVI